MGGCSFQFPVVPRARADSMVFATHQADMLLPASQNAERDQKAQFVHLVNLTPALITLQKRSQCADRSTPFAEPYQNACRTGVLAKHFALPPATP